MMIQNFKDWLNESQQEDQVLDTSEKIKSWLDLMNIQNYTINDDLTVDVKGHVKLKKQKFKKFPIKFGKIHGDFNCDGCTSLTSLDGAPQEVGGDFYCNGCTSLTTLEGAPQKVSGYFYCYGCTSLTSLEGAPQKVSGYFYCRDCTSLTSLEGAPQEVGGDFYCYGCTSLTSLEGAPQEVGGGFYTDNPVFLLLLKKFTYGKLIKLDFNNLSKEIQELLITMAREKKATWEQIKPYVDPEKFKRYRASQFVSRLGLD